MKDIVYLGIGGWLGAWARYGLQLAVPQLANGFPVAVLTINLVGCLFLGWFFTVALRSSRITPRVRLMIGTGFTGAFTTFSTFAVDILRLFMLGQIVEALVYVVSSLVGGILLAWFGIRLGMYMNKRLMLRDGSSRKGEGV